MIDNDERLVIEAEGDESDTYPGYDDASDIEDEDGSEDDIEMGKDRPRSILKKTHDPFELYPKKKVSWKYDTESASEPSLPADRMTMLLAVCAGALFLFVSDIPVIIVIVLAILALFLMNFF